ncbi:MAG TPA: biopolymer transporter ExbD [Planctomycetaceae bacterium]|nr:biopolymer transporter ExbD [Planctomycetaceae bacterium]
MPIQYYCHACNQRMSISTRQIGKLLPCPNCGVLREVPAENESPPESRTVKHAPAHAVAALPEEPLAADLADGGFQARRPQTQFDDMDLTPMVDVTFLLLIFFMITASFSLQKTLAVPPPDSNAKGARQMLSMDELTQNSINVRIDEKNRIFLDELPIAEAANLIEALTQARAATQRSELLLDADAAAYHETVVSVIDAANAAGLERIRLLSKPSTTQSKP